MKPYYQDNHVQIFNKDCRDMSELPDGSVQMVCCSPPYWGLRKYSGEQELVWGDNHCEHEWGSQERWLHRGTTKSPKLTDGMMTEDKTMDAFCSLCGAWKGAFGLEPTPEMYVEHTIQILREIRRVLRKDGVVFWNIGDSYQGGNRGASAESDIRRGDQGGSFQPHNVGAKGIVSPSRLSHPLIKPKDLCLIPFRVAIACQEDGWWVRSVIIWSKPNPMPESCRDRPTESHEYILMLTKNKTYYWDAEAVREQSIVGGSVGAPQRDTRETYGLGGGNSGLSQAKLRAKLDGGFSGRNIRTVWEFPTQPYPEAHFAVFPEKLPETCIKAATPEVGCCSKCGAPWERITARENMKIRRTDWNERAGNRTGSAGTMLEPARVETIGWKPTCKCGTRQGIDAQMPTIPAYIGREPSTVLDPFMGTGTTLWVAKKLNRRAVGYEISQEYCDLALDRNRQQVLL